MGSLHHGSYFYKQQTLCGSTNKTLPMECPMRNSLQYYSLWFYNISYTQPIPRLLEAIFRTPKGVITDVGPSKTGLYIIRVELLGRS